MDSGSDDDSLLLLVYLIWTSVGDSEVLALVACDGSAQGVSGHIVQLTRLDLTEVIVQVRVGIRLRVREVD